MITKGIIQRIYDASSIQRWNDHVRPVELTELDKQAHKLIIAYIIAKLEPVQLTNNDWIKLIEGSLFEFFQRVVLTDIKPPVFHKMYKKRKKELNNHIFDQLRPEMEKLGNDIFTRFTNYLESSRSPDRVRRILSAAHYLASEWEFKIIYHSCPYLYGIDQTKQDIENQIEDHFDIAGVQKIYLGKKSYGFIDLCGQLRFQKRWAQTPRIPQTSVLGHMLVVSYLTYLCSCEFETCFQRKYNNSFAGLFHDLPEVLTRDIISPVKRSVKDLDDIIKEIERQLIEDKILPLLPNIVHAEMESFLDLDIQWENRVWKEPPGEYKVVDRILDNDNIDSASPIDGKVIKACDHLAAFIEATKSIDHGIRSHHLQDGIDYLWSKYEGQTIAKVDFGSLFGYFI